MISVFNRTITLVDLRRKKDQDLMLSLTNYMPYCKDNPMWSLLKLLSASVPSHK